MKNPHPPIKYIDPMIDFGFKKIFKESGKKQLIIRPLNAIFGLDIADIEIRESEQMGLVREAHHVSYDLYCTNTDGNRFIVEVQLADQAFFLERALFYTSFPIAKSMPKTPLSLKGKKKKLKQRVPWNYNYPPVFFLGLLNFDIRHINPQQNDPEQFIHIFSLRNEQTGELMTDRLRFAFLEVARFDRPKEACSTFEERFLFMMKNLPNFVETPELWADEDPYFQEFLQEAEFANMTDRQQERYLARMIREWDDKNAMDFAKKKAMEEGIAEGRAKGLAEGRAKGLAEGRAKGRAEGRAEGRTEGKMEHAIETARKMSEDNEPIEKIVKYSGLTEEQIRSLV